MVLDNRLTLIWLLKTILSTIFKQSFYTYTISGHSSKHSLLTVSHLHSRGPLYLIFASGSYVSQYLSSYFVVWRSFSRRFHRKGSWEPYSLSSVCSHFTWKLHWIKNSLIHTCFLENLKSVTLNFSFIGH